MPSNLSSPPPFTLTSTSISTSLLLPPSRFLPPLPPALPRPADQPHQILLRSSPFPLLSFSPCRLLFDVVIPRRHPLRVPPAPKPLPERPQPPGLVGLDVEQLLARRVPERGVAGVFCGAVDRGRGRGAVGEGAPVRERDQLGEGVGALGAVDDGCVADLVLAVRRVVVVVRGCEGGEESSGGCCG